MQFRLLAALGDCTKQGTMYSFQSVVLVILPVGLGQVLHVVSCMKAPRWIDQLLDLLAEPQGVDQAQWKHPSAHMLQWAPRTVCTCFQVFYFGSQPFFYCNDRSMLRQIGGAAVVEVE